MDADDLISLFGKITTTDHDTLVDQFSTILRTEKGVAQFFLEASNWNVEVAVINFLSSVGSDGETITTTSTIPEVTFLSDLSELQSIVFAPSTRIPMLWKFRNSGKEPWPADTQIVFVEGQRLNGPSSINNIHANPGEEVVVNCELVSPATVGTFVGTWRFACSAGYFGDPLWVIITVDDSSEELTEKLNAMSSHNQQFMHQNAFQQQQQYQQQQYMLQQNNQYFSQAFVQNMGMDQNAMQMQQQQQQQHQGLLFQQPLFTLPSSFPSNQQQVAPSISPGFNMIANNPSVGKFQADSSANYQSNNSNSMNE